VIFSSDKSSEILLYLSEIVKVLLGKDENLAVRYIAESVVNSNNTENYDIEIEENANNIANAILDIIKNNERIIDKYGIESYIDEEYPAKDYEVGYRHLGKVLVSPFDWSVDNEGNFDYSFELAKML
jgi:hypothetical protein